VKQPRERPKPTKNTPFPPYQLPKQEAAPIKEDEARGRKCKKFSKLFLASNGIKKERKKEST
jgi:hypothetical protein